MLFHVCAVTTFSWSLSLYTCTSFLYCHHIVFQLAVDVLDTPFDLCVVCPVIIGSIPLRSIVQQYMPNYQPPPVTEQPVAFGGPVQSDIRKCIICQFRPSHKNRELSVVRLMFTNGHALSTGSEMWLFV